MWARTMSLFGILMGLALSTPAQPLRVAVSIAPVHSWVAQVSGELWQPELLFSAQIDPHNALLRPSQRQLVEQADWVIWLGPQFETGLRALMQRVPEQRQWVLSADTEHFVLHDLRTEGTLFAMPEQHQAVSFPNMGFGGDTTNPWADLSGPDPHLWLDPNNAMQAFTVIAAELSARDPAHAETYQRNAEQARMRLAQAISGWQKQMAEAEWGPYVVFHDGFQYFDQAFDVPFGGAITLNPEQLPGLQTLQRIQTALSQEPLSCLFAEAQYSQRYVDLLSQMLNLDALVIDALGVTSEPGASHYETLMNQLVTAFLSCAKAE